jgi:hypothetical protein
MCLFTYNCAPDCDGYRSRGIESGAGFADCASACGGYRYQHDDRNQGIHHPEKRGYIEIDRRHGAKVREGLSNNHQFNEKLEEELSLIVAESKAKGMDKETFLKICEKTFNDMNTDKLKEQQA